ncbi:hypothetical protein PC129_g14633 [Phytophthora cactorum]|uniref:Uncharacterized protein n=1 Tax=Phytophthora cactorum TaxID=29920 RepID=A0A329S0D6_9STRA|nr:hypothetical protein Pcac1_g23219 [Phytophthora cactorum]KAG2812954.1 hypothetical protein PC112_g14959 [Phytophthora cactorum]KAG2897701.1 hypothetical protein PC114_g14579 [Phytophthora cactorum]KAG3077488.1 hypothetical protein PC122_g13135 [Phytophthora cactorum]KAG3214449.1 hypothetical protein PC129_g14633 [Phytophthora cactorum]
MTSAGASDVAAVGIVQDSTTVEGSAVGMLVDAAPRPGSKDAMNATKSNPWPELDAASGFGSGCCTVVVASVVAAEFLSLFDFGGPPCPLALGQRRRPRLRQPSCGPCRLHPTSGRA